ncbi:MAG: hypothetical protein HNEKOMLI_00857 [Sodalis sp. Psp]|nr:hypothetical protein [Sodalis sp. Psp]MCR3757170.1 hypothetical protein [Sodalis sp. Ppy]
MHTKRSEGEILHRERNTEVIKMAHFLGSVDLV